MSDGVKILGITKRMFVLCLLPLFWIMVVVLWLTGGPLYWVITGKGWWGKWDENVISPLWSKGTDIICGTDS